VAIEKAGVAHRIDLVAGDVARQCRIVGRRGGHDRVLHEISPAPVRCCAPAPAPGPGGWLLIIDRPIHDLTRPASASSRFPCKPASDSPGKRDP
jgi:hypothetical protein